MSLDLARPAGPHGRALLRAQSVQRYSWWMVWLALGLFSAAVICPAYIVHDDGWYLHMARVLLNGGKIYQDVVDTNPPLIVFLTLPPVWIAEHLGLSAVAVFKVYVFVAALLSLVSCARVLKSVLPAQAPASRGLLLTALVFAILPFARVPEFGQREHLMLLLTLPYLLAAVGWASGHRLGRTSALLAGLAAGLGFAMKPHYLLAWLAIEASLALIVRRGSWRRAEAAGAVAAFVLYALAVVVFVPQYLVLADKVRQVYGGLNSSPALLFRLPDAQLWAAGFVLLLLVRLPRAARPASVVLFAAWTGFLLAAVLQLKGWSYHLYPGRAVALLFFVTFGLAVFEVLPEIGNILRGGARALGAGLVLALLVSSGRYLIEARRPVDTDLVTPLIDTIRAHAPGGPIAVLSMRTIIYPAFPAVNYSGARWSMRHNSLWFLPGLYINELQAPDADQRFRAPAAMSPVERQFYEEVVGDLCADPPALLLVEPALPRAPAGRRALDLAAYYGQDARYQQLSRGYQRLTAIGPFTVYQRTGTASCGTGR
jgi:hypothetical protein